MSKRLFDTRALQHKALYNSAAAAAGVRSGEINRHKPEENEMGRKEELENFRNMIEAYEASIKKKNNKGTVCPQAKQSSMLFVFARSNRRHLHLYFNNSACFVPCQQTILGAVAEFAFSRHNPCFQNLTPTEFTQSLLRACCLTARRYKAPWAFQMRLYISPAISHGSHLSCFYLIQRRTSDVTVFA